MNNRHALLSILLMWHSKLANERNVNLIDFNERSQPTAQRWKEVLWKECSLYWLFSTLNTIVKLSTRIGKKYHIYIENIDREQYLLWPRANPQDFFYLYVILGHNHIVEPHLFLLLDEYSNIQILYIYYNVILHFI